MKTELAQNTYITTGPCIFTKPESSKLIYTPILELDEAIQKHKDSNVILIAATARQPFQLIETAYERGIKVYFNKNLTYDFKGIWDNTRSRDLNLVKLLSIAHEPIFLDVAINILFENFKHIIPSKIELKTALGQIKANVSPLLNPEAAEERFKSMYEEHCASVYKYIEPDLSHQRINVVPISYKNDLSNYLRNHQGLFVLREAMSAGKTSRGIIPLFEHCTNKENSKALLVAPNIALTRSLQQILIENGNVKTCDYQHYLDISQREPLKQPASLICCVNSATTKEEFIQHNNDCDTVLIDEIQACLNVFSQRLIGDKKLSTNGKAMQSFFTLLKKPTVLIADALINEFTMQKIIEQTDREITILQNNDEIYSAAKEVHLYSRTDHVDQTIFQVNESHCEVGFCDGGQKLSTTYFDLVEVIKKSIKGNVLTINADFLGTKVGKSFINSPLKAINEAIFTLFSPAITAGQNFPFEQFTRSNLFAHETISPLQLIQSSGRFRHANVTQISFVKGSFAFHDNARGIRENAVMDTTKYREFDDELEYAEQNTWCEYIVESIIQENILRQRYKNNTLILFQRLGGKIIRKSENETQRPAKKKLICFDVTKDIRPITRSKYEQLLQKSLFLNDEEKEQIYIFELFDFFNVLDKPENYQEVITFDKTGKAKDWMHNLHLCRNSDFNKDISTVIKLKQMMSLKVLSLLGLDSQNLEGVYGYEEINKLERFLRHGKLKLHKKTLEVKKIKKRIFDIPHGKKPSVNKGAFVKSILAKLFGLEHEIANRDKSNERGEYSYRITTESKGLVNKYYERFSISSS